MDYRQKINLLHDAKVEMNQKKLDANGVILRTIDDKGEIHTRYHGTDLSGGKPTYFYDIDDHGFIHWEEPVPFTPWYPTHANKAVGPVEIGRNFRNWLEAHPVIIHPASALACGWIGYIPFNIGWPDEEYPSELAPLWKKYNIVYSGVGGMNHLGPDVQIGLQLGWGGLLRKIRHYRMVNAPSCQEFYQGEEDVVLGIQSFISRHAEYARELAEKETDSELKQNYLEIAKMNEWLVDNPPRTFREAVQFINHFQTVDCMYNTGGAMGQLDRWLQPYFRKDKEAGILTDEQAIWYMASLFYNEAHYSQIGGEAPDGSDLTCDMSYIILEAMHALKIPCNVALRVHENMDRKLLRRAVEILFEDGTGVDYSCAKGLNEGYIRNGFPLEIARMRAKVGCNWTALPGVEYCLQDVSRLCMVKPFTIALDEMMELPEEEYSLDKLWELYGKHLAVTVQAMKDGHDAHARKHGKYCPEIILNLFCHGTIERGLDCCDGGVDIYNYTQDGVGMPTVADSFAAIEQRVVNEKRLTWKELKHVLDTNYEGAEDVRLMLKNINRYGSGGSLGDKWAMRIRDLYVDLVKGSPLPNTKYNVIPGMFSHGIVEALGRGVPATPNGRKNGEAIAHNVDPDPGFIRNGQAAPTAKAVAVAMCQPGWGNSAPLQIELDTALAHNAGGVEAVENLIMTHNEMGGTLININILSKDKLLDAHEDPSRHPDLVVRVTGYSAFFCSLSPEYRQQVVDRILAES